MSLIYKFKKEKLVNGGYAIRPRILVILKGKQTQIETPALIDSGCDTTVIPESIAKAIGLDMWGEKIKLYAYHESTDAIQSKASVTFLGRGNRDSVILNIPILIALSDVNNGYEEDITWD